MLGAEAHRFRGSLQLDVRSAEVRPVKKQDVRSAVNFNTATFRNSWHRGYHPSAVIQRDRIITPTHSRSLRLIPKLHVKRIVRILERGDNMQLTFIMNRRLRAVYKLSPQVRCFPVIVAPKLSLASYLRFLLRHSGIADRGRQTSFRQMIQGGTRSENRSPSSRYYSGYSLYHQLVAHQVIQGSYPGQVIFSWQNARYR